VNPKNETYRELLHQAEHLFEGERDPIAHAANLAALLWHTLPDLNWAGFYFRKGDALLLGPFQGRPACIRIGWGKGVCGTAAAEARTIVVDDVHGFDGHIACDAASKSELVTPLIRDGAVIGVIDLDSPLSARFDGEDAAGMKALAELYVRATG